MGARFRRSINFGPLRFTLTPKGISKSLGFGPFRVTKRADGQMQTTTRIPGTGLSYVAKTKKPRAVPVPDVAVPQPTAPRWLTILLLIVVGIFFLMIFGTPSK